MGKRWLQRALLLQVAASLACFSAELICKYTLHLTGPYVWPLLNDGTFFIDLKLLEPRFTLLHSRAFFSAPGFLFAYPPGAGLIYAALQLFSPGRHRLFVHGFLMLAILAIAAALFARSLTKRGMVPFSAAAVAVGGALLSYPFWFDFQRGNIELYVWGLAALGLWSFSRQHGYFAAACFALAASMKWYPILYLGLFLSQRRWRELFFGLGCFSVALGLSAWVLCPDLSLAVKGTQEGLEGFARLCLTVRDPGFLAVDHSLFALYKFCLASRAVDLVKAAAIYTRLSAAVGLLLYAFLIRRLSIPRQVVALTCAMILLPPVSFDYSLMHVYSAFAFLLLAEWSACTRSTGFLLGGLLLAASPLTEFIRHGYTLEGQLKALLLLILFSVTLLAPSPSAETVPA